MQAKDFLKIPPCLPLTGQSSTRKSSVLTFTGGTLSVVGLAGWQSGYAADCKSVYVGSIPASASTEIGSKRETRLEIFRDHHSGVAQPVEQAAVNRLVGGSSPSSRANEKGLAAKWLGLFFNVCGLNARHKTHS